MRRVFQRVSEPHQRPRTCPPPQPLSEKLSQFSQGAPQGAHHDNERKFLERRGGAVSPPLTRTVRVPITTTMEFRGGGGEKRRYPPPPPLPTSPRPPVATNPAMTGLQQNENDRGRPMSLPATPRNEGFSYPGSDLARRRPSLRTKTRRYEEDLPVFNNGIGGGPIQRYPILEDRYQPLFTGSPSSPTSLTSSPSRPYNGADAQQLKRSGRPEQFSNSRKS